MSVGPVIARDALTRQFLFEFPREAARHLERLSDEDAAALLAQQSAREVMPIWEALLPGLAAMSIENLPDPVACDVLSEMNTGQAAVILSRLSEEARERLLSLLPIAAAAGLRKLMAYPADSAGHIMDTRIVAFRGDTTAADTLRRLRSMRARPTRNVLLADDENRLLARVPIEQLALASGDEPIETLANPPVSVAYATDPLSDVVDKLNRYRLEELPVIDIDGRLLGVIRPAGLVEAAQEEVSVDIQTIFGASKEERALSSSFFAVRKRQPWLQINLLTAFLAAAVVGSFEDTIAQFTALAVLLPVVAGQSGNTGAQALAVAMRGLALREINTADWFRVTAKETLAGFLNGLGIATTCAIGVYIWSQNLGLCLVIVLSMVMSMVMAGAAGALVPIALQRIGQDPAQSSSIVLTTITDIAGFFSFLGIASLLLGMIAGKT
jgi:magnesium transporter